MGRILQARILLLSYPIFYFFFIICCLPKTTRAAFPYDFSDVVWLHTDVSSWAKTGVLSLVATDASTITLDYDKARVWPAKPIPGGDGNVKGNGNPWIFVQENGVWYGATWEWLTFGQTVKSKRAVNGDHIKRAPLDDFVPQKGEIYGFMISGLARDSRRNVQERTNVVLYEWEVGMVPLCTGPPVIDYFLTPSVVLRRNERAAISWQIQGADSATLKPFPGVISIPWGMVGVQLEKTTGFTLTATNDCGNTVQMKTVEVLPVNLMPINLLLFE
jgi:hypothetical protein